MLNLYCKLKALRATRDQGVTTVEYALILLTVVLVIGGILWGFSQTISILGVDPNVQQVLTGLIVIGAVLATMDRSRLFVTK